MSVFFSDIKPHTFPYPGYSGPSMECFFCFNPIGESLVTHWEGVTAIYMHPECGRKLAEGLTMDANRAARHPASKYVFTPAKQAMDELRIREHYA